MSNINKTRNCPFCKEEIKTDAIKCKHCHSFIAPEKPLHDGTCPYCKEQIHNEAIKCKHCGSNLGFGSPSHYLYMQQEKSLPPLLAAIHNKSLRSGGLFGIGDFHCLENYITCRKELEKLGVPDEDAIDWCVFKYWGCTVREGFYNKLFY